MSSKTKALPRFPKVLTSEAVLRFYEALDCSSSLKAAILYRYGEFDQLVGLECDPLHYESGALFRDNYLACNLLKRSRFLRTSFDKEELAIDKFKKFEDLCSQTNSRLKSIFLRPNEKDVNWLLFQKFASKIVSILGEFSTQEFFDSAYWGPGVSTLIKGDRTSAANKFQHDAGITRDLYPLVKDSLPLAYPGWDKILRPSSLDLCVDGSDPFPHFEVGNSIITVPKTSKIDRVIAVEPGINLWFQLSIGQMIRRRLKRSGIDLTDQSSNQRLAKSSSMSDDLATVDFSSASDSIASELVFKIFEVSQHENSPSTSWMWLSVMDSCRCHYGNLNGKIIRWNKFSSMGNGFTFDLESLIFYSAAFVCCKHMGCDVSKIGVYGDDVIIPSSVYDLFSSFSDFLGFRINETKSFSRGSFRESCGSHYYRGVDCKPVFLEEALSSLQEVYNFANTVRLRSHFYYGCDVRFRRLFYFLVNSVPKKYRFKVPLAGSLTGPLILDSQIFGIRRKRPTSRYDGQPSQGGFLSNFDESGALRCKYGIEGYQTFHLAWIPLSEEVCFPGLLQARIHSMSVDNDAGNMVSLRNRTRTRVKRLFVRQWYNLGPWI
jgi:hypothetical protein